MPSLDSMLAQVGKGPVFGGPNCYNTALLATGVLDSRNVRYVHSGEFEEILKTQFDLVPPNEAAKGDLVVFHATTGRDHAAVLIDAQTVFHKKDVSRKLPYRLVPLKDVFEPDPAETVDPFEGGRLPHRREDASKDVAIYRRKSDVLGKKEELNAKEKAFVDLANFYEGLVLQQAPQWAVPKNLGIVTERILAELVRDNALLAKSKASALRIAYQKLESLSHQVFLSIEETAFSSRFASAKHDQISTQYYLGDQEILTQQINTLARFLERSLSPEQVSLILQTLEKDRSHRRVSVTGLISESKP